VHLAIADPSSDVLVAELPITYLDNVPEWRNSDGGGNNASWQMFEWVQRRARLEQTRLKSGTVVVGFAIWRWRGTNKIGDGEAPRLNIIQAFQCNADQEVQLV
jgi:hypothetical protein